MSTKTRLSPEDWLVAARRALLTHGPAGVAAEPLARSLNTTKGSFYWHFKDVPALHSALLRDWQAQALAQVMALLEATTPPEHTLRSFGQAVLSDPVETALRGWAHTSSEVAQMLSDVDAERLACVTRLLTRLDLPNPDFARALLASLIGLRQMQIDTPQNAYDTLLDTVLALR